MLHDANNCPFYSKLIGKGGCQGVKEMRLSGDTLLTGVLLLESGANRSVDGVSIWSLTCEICLNRAFPSSRAYKQSDRVSTVSTVPHQRAMGKQAFLHRCSRNIAERRETPRRRACFWNSTDPGTAELCSPQHAPIAPEIRTSCKKRNETPNILLQPFPYRCTSCRLVVKRGGRVLTPQEKMSCM